MLHRTTIAPSFLTWSHQYRMSQLDSGLEDLASASHMTAKATAESALAAPKSHRDSRDRSPATASAGSSAYDTVKASTSAANRYAPPTRNLVKNARARSGRSTAVH
jgi:hypothetical protein